MTACSSSNISPVCEQKHLLPENTSRPGNVYLPSFIAGQPAALDVTITSPLQATLISDAARKCGFALTLAEDKKLGHNYQKCSDMGIHFIPLALETFGGLSKTTRKTLKRIDLLSDNRGFQPLGLSVAFSCLAQAVSVSALRGSATMLIARDSRLWARIDGDCRIQFCRYAQSEGQENPVQELTNLKWYWTQFMRGEPFCV